MTTPPSPPAVSVVIPTHDRAAFLPRCVSSVLAQDYQGPLDVLLVNDCSTDDTQRVTDALCAAHPNVRALHNGRNRGHAYCRNVGALGTCGDYLLFLDDDNRLDPHAVAALVACARTHPDAGLVAPLAFNCTTDRDGTVTDRRVWSCGLRYHPWLSVSQALRPDLERIANDPSLPPMLPSALRTEYAPNAYLIRRDHFRAADGFDARLRIFEDADLSFRLRRRLALETYFCADARTDHYHGLGHRAHPLRRLGQETGRRAFWMQYFRAVFWRRHYPLPQALCVALLATPALCAFYVLKTLRYGRPDIALANVAGTLAGACRALTSDCRDGWFLPTKGGVA